MKRIIAVVLWVMFIATVASGWYETSGPSSGGSLRWKSYEIINTSGVYQITNVPTTSIIPNVHSILGFYIMPRSINAEIVVTLYDQTVATPDELIDEAEAAPNSGTGKWFSFPRKIEGQLSVRQGPNTKVVVFFDTI